MARYHIAPDPSLHLRDPASSALGQRILKDGLSLMNKLGLEGFTFRKLAEKVDRDRSR